MTLLLNRSGVRLVLSGFLRGRFCTVLGSFFGFSFYFLGLFMGSGVAPISDLGVSVFTGFQCLRGFGVYGVSVFTGFSGAAS